MWGNIAIIDDIRKAAAAALIIERFLRPLGDGGIATRHPQRDTRAADDSPRNRAGADGPSNATPISWRRAGPVSTLRVRRIGHILGDTPSFFLHPDSKSLLPHLAVGGGASDCTPPFQVEAGDGPAPAL